MVSSQQVNGLGVYQDDLVLTYHWVCQAILSHLKELFFLGSQYNISFKKYHVQQQYHFFNGIHEAKV